MGAQWDKELEDNYEYGRYIIPMPADFSTKDKDILMRYTRWLNRRGFFREDLQCDFEHQIETFLSDFNNDTDD